MAQSFGKRPNDYLNLPSTSEMINAITRKNGIAQNQVVSTIRGGNNSGTWMSEDVAIEFARWLSPAFTLWANDRIWSYGIDEPNTSTFSPTAEQKSYKRIVISRT